MAPNDNTRITETEGEPSAFRRKATRYALPVAVAGVAAATIGLVPALAAAGGSGPQLADISAQQLIEKIAASDTQQLSGSLKITTDLGLPALSGLDSVAGALGDSAGAGDGSTADPGTKLMELASGSHTLRVAADGADKQRLSIVEGAAEYSLIRNGDEVWAYDSGSNQAYHATEKDAGGHGGSEGTKGEGAQGAKDLDVTPSELAAQVLKAAGDTTSVTVDGTARVAGHDAYRLLVKPKQSGSTVGSVTIAVDAKTGTPLKFTLASSGGGKPIVDVGFTKVDFAKPDASTFDFTPPKGTKVTRADESDAAHGKDAKNEASGADQGEGRFGGLLGELSGADDSGDVKTIGKGWSTVYELTSPKDESGAAGKGSEAAGSGASKQDDLPAEAEGLIGSLGSKVTGKFGSGMVFETRIVNALMTDDGKVYVGAVTKDALLKAANQAN
ncbi:LolA family protein [Streptomyces corynorhini]|uniref:Outer membrane lipoprotein carrier protein LolA n=1 Tax=Streptomyces corynorhini TaxID=2282652 RepID=A0A370BH73_9ACTN|nr:outer membrane lipoprotein carrier protein LolA [Streptomyces corynorhini]RDG38735.1 outer membrane lipoprotein carrier protein LolA [Streptomyces corynorhini]